MLYAAKCYWPGVTEDDVQRVADGASRDGVADEKQLVAYLGSLLFAADDLVLCLFEARSRAAVKRASEQLGIPCERVMDPVWLAPHGPTLPTQPSVRPRRNA